MFDLFISLLDWLSGFVLLLLQNTVIGFLFICTIVLLALEFIINFFINFRR